MASPYETVFGGCRGAKGTRIITPIPFPSRVFIQKLIVRQTSGPDGADFQVDLFNSAQSQLHESLSDDGAGAGGGDVSPEELYKVIPSQYGSAGKLEYWPEEGHPFVNMDGNITTGNPRMIYLGITVTSGDDGAEYEFACSIGAKQPV